MPARSIHRTSCISNCSEALRSSDPITFGALSIPTVHLAKGFAYLVTNIDGYSHKVLSWRISDSMDSTFCVDCLEGALANHGKPEIFNSERGSRFTSTSFTDILTREGEQINMDGRGRALDNIFAQRLWRTVNYEDVCLKGYSTMA